MEIVLGREYKDKILGIKGIATVHSKYLTGCDRIYLEYVKSGKVEGETFDITRLEPTGKKAKNLTESDETGGPRDSLSKSSHA